MQGLDKIAEFRALTLPERLSFWEEHITNIVASLPERQLNEFLGGIITDCQENNYVRQKALNALIDLVVLGQLKPRHALTLLIDSWQDDTDIFLQMQRIKYLYLFYDLEQNDIESIYHSYLESHEAELVSESHFHLGLINMQKGFTSDDLLQSRKFLVESQKEFSNSTNVIENRADATIYAMTVSIVLDILSGISGSIKASLGKLGQMLFQKEAFSFRIMAAPFYFGFYRVLTALSLITQEEPAAWLNFRQSLSHLFFQYATIKNEEIKEHLNLSTLSSVIIKRFERQIIEPFFALNFSAEKSKIDARLEEVAPDSPEADFLHNLRSIAINSDSKKKAESEILIQQLSRLFPDVSQQTLEDTLLKIEETQLPFRLFKAFEALARPSSNQLTDKILSSCLSMQGNRIYYGNYSEDDRNTFVASMLQASGYHCKDQTRRSTSPSGKSAGEIDILIEDIQHNPIAIIEALNLTSVSTTYIQLHLDKIFTYDANGLPNNYILVYANAKNFESLYSGYKSFVTNHNFQYQMLQLEEQINFPYTELKKFTTKHLRNNGEINIHHILINLYVNPSINKE